MTSIWEAAHERARKRAVARLRSDIAREEWPHCSDALTDCLLEEDARWRPKYEAIMAPGWIPKRGSRRMPKPWKIAIYWHQRGHPVAGIITLPYCYRCGYVFRFVPALSPEGRWNAAELERAHLVDRIRGGLDGPQNLMPLCHRCHKIMPSFDPGEGPDAMAWVMRGGRTCLRIAVPDGKYRHFKAMAVRGTEAPELVTVA